MSETNDGPSRVLTVVILVMLLASSPVSAIGHTGSSHPPASTTSDGDGDFTFSDMTYPGCVEFSGDGETQCDAGVTDKISVTYDEIPTTEAGKMKLQVDATIESGLTGNYAVRARADDGYWSQAPLTDGNASLSVENTYRRGSIQYPTLYVEVVNLDTGATNALGSLVAQNPVVIPSGDESWYDGRVLDDGGTDSPTKGITVVGSDTTSVLQPTYSTVARFNDNDGTHEDFEDKTIPPVKYSDSGVLIAGPRGNVLHFENLREDTRFPAILRHSGGRMQLGTALYGVPSANYQKLRIDYGLQTESLSQTVQVNLVNRYGAVIDPSMKNAPSRRLMQTTGKDADYFADRQQYENAIYETNLNTSSVEIPLTSAEKQYIKQNNELYVTYSTDNRAYLLLYRTPVISQSVQNQTGDNFVPDLKHFEEEFNSDPGGETAATFDAQYEIKGELNDKYQSFDRQPGDPIKIQVTVDNHGDERVERRVGIYSMSENNKSLYGAAAEPKILDKRVVAVEPRSSKTFTVKYSYAKHEFGNHQVSVLDTTDPNNPIQISRVRDGQNVSKVYVLQPATFVVRQVITPNSWLIHDNFNTTVVVQNVGDLNGTGVLTGEFQEWKGHTQIPNTRGGNVREGAYGSYANITFSRKGFDYSPSYPARPANGDDSKRPLSPFGTKLTYSDNRPHKDRAPDNASKFKATTSHPFAMPNDKLYASLNHSEKSRIVRIYKLDIVTIKVENERSNSDTWYASGWGYTNSTPSPYWDAWTKATSYDIFENPKNGIPTLSGANYLYPPYKMGDGQNPMNVTVVVRNNGMAAVGDARIRVTTDKIGLAGGDVVGLSGASDIKPWNTRALKVPIVIRNDPGNDGVHTLSARLRTAPDYIQRVHVRNNEDSGTITDQFETQVDIELWADFVYEQTTTSDYTRNERCTGYNPSDPDSEKVVCDGTPQTFQFSQFHWNRGGVAGNLTVDAFIGTWRDPSGQSKYSDFGLVSDPFSSSTNHWVTQEKNLRPNERKGFNAQDIPFKEPGVYVVKSTPNRVNYENSDLPHYNDTSYVPQTDWLMFKVLDITNPESHAEISDTTYNCKSGTCDSSDGTWTIWEGGYVEFNNESVDNVIIDRLVWSGPSYNGGYRDCHGQTNGGCYTQDGLSSNTSADKIVHRFRSSGTHSITLTTYDHPAYGAGAPVNGTGTPNTDSDTWNLTVKPDSYTPNASVKVSSKNNPDNSPDGTTVWHTDSGTNYDGIEVCFTASASDGEIGIEADEWTGVAGSSNQDTRCRTWSSTGTKTITYDAWDFAGNTAHDEVDVTVQSDTTNPNVSLSGSRSNKWVDKDYWNSHVDWTATASDGETGLINCDDGGAYTWTGDTNSVPTSCDNKFRTSYSSATESGTTFRVDVTVSDYHGNTDSAYDTIVQYEDKTSPYADGDKNACSSGYSDEDGCSVSASASYYDKGPDGGIGVHHTSGAGGDASVSASAYADASTGFTTCETWHTASDEETASGWVTVYDYHGNPSSSVYIEAYAYDEDRDYWDCTDGDGDGYYPEDGSDPDDSDACVPESGADNDGDGYDECEDPDDSDPCNPDAGTTACKLKNS